MNAIALVVGNTDYYGEHNKLINAVNDANDFSTKLLSLGFVVRKTINCKNEQFERAVQSFSDDLKSYDVGLFYFSGHGLQIDGQNYLTSLDTNFSDSISVKHSSIPLKEVMDYMQNDKTLIKILILDACRNNPLPERGTNLGLAPIYAPKGTIIAFSTSPGETAMDYGAGKNSIYTGSLLNHIDDRNIPIEDFFKRVRTSVYTLSNGKQTSWEHTSLIGNFCFNSGQLIHSPKIPYREDCVIDKTFESHGTEIDEIIIALKSYDWYIQHPAIQKLNSLSPKNIDISTKFLLGRNILQTAIGGEFSACSIFNNLSDWLSRWFDGDDNHVLNGILYEIYFNSDGKLRLNGFKANLINQIFILEENKRFIKSFEFIKEQLIPFKEKVYYIPSPSPVSLPIEIITKKKEELIWDIKMTKNYLISIRINNVELFSYNENLCYTIVKYEDFLKKISYELCAPLNRLKMSGNEKDLETIDIPLGNLITKI